MDKDFLLCNANEGQQRENLMPDLQCTMFAYDCLQLELYSVQGYVDAVYTLPIQYWIRMVTLIVAVIPLCNNYYRIVKSYRWTIVTTTPFALYDIKLDSLKTSVSFKFMIILVIA